MREDDSAAVGKKRGRKRDGRVQILSDVEIAVIDCCSDDFEQEFVRLGNWRRNVVQSKSMIILRRGNSDGFGHAETLAAKAS